MGISPSKWRAMGESTKRARADGRWKVCNLSPYNVPANAICRVRIQNTSVDSPYYGGVRETGSSLDRKVHLAPKAGRTMTVTSDKKSNIEIYAEDDRYIKFTFTGHFHSKKA